MEEKAFTIGHLAVNSGVALAPMAGVTDAAFRTLCRELGFRGLMFTEMASAKGLCFGDAKSRDIADTAEAERPVAVQLFGSDPASVARAVEMLNAGGADMIDINMGCPMQKIVKNGEGAALMLNPGLAASIVRAAADVSVKPVSVKIRKGWDDSNVNAAAFAQRLEDAGASMITVHGRTREQMYGGRADWQIIADVKRSVGIPVIGNGDIACAADAARMFAETGCDAVMPGRAVRGNPWLLTELENGICRGASDRYDVKDTCGTRDRLSVIKRHFELAVATRGERTGVLEMRKHLAWYLRGARNAAAAKRELMGMTDYGKIMGYIESIFI